jgi:hypothetical protein
MHRLAQRPVLVSDQPAWDASVPEIDSDLGFWPGEAGG